MQATTALMDQADRSRWANPEDLQAELDAQVRRLTRGKEHSELAAIFKQTHYNSERTHLLYKLTEPRVRKRMVEAKMAHWEWVICAHDRAVSFSLRASKSLNDFKETPYADHWLPVPLYWDEQ